MENKNYKARVEISMIVEIEDIPAAHEDNAADSAETIAQDIAAKTVRTAEEFEGCFVKNWCVECIDVEEEEEK